MSDAHSADAALLALPATCMRAWHSPWRLLRTGAVASTSAAAGTAVSAAATPAGAAPATTASTGGAAQGAISATPAAALNAGTAATTSGAATAAAIKTAAVTTVASPSPSPSPSPAAAAAAAATTGSVIGYTEPTAAELGRMRKAAKVLDPELMEPVPETFEQGVKNPCWAAPDGSYRSGWDFGVEGGHAVAGGRCRGRRRRLASGGKGRSGERMGGRARGAGLVRTAAEADAAGSSGKTTRKTRR